MSAPCKHEFRPQPDGVHACAKCQESHAPNWKPTPDGHQCVTCRFRRPYAKPPRARESIAIFETPDGLWRCSVFTHTQDNTVEEVVIETHTPALAASTARRQMLTRWGKALS